MRPLRNFLETPRYGALGRFACVQALFFALPAFAHAEEGPDASVASRPSVAERRHRVSFSIGYAAADGNTDIEGDHRVAEHAGCFRGGYAYRLLSWFEAGADLSYWATGTTSAIQAAIPSVAIRPFLPIGDRVEVGFTGRAGVLIWPQTGLGTGVWVGPGLSAGPDVRVWITDAVGVLAAGDFTAAGGKGPGELNKVNERASFWAGGVFVGAIARL